MSDLPPGARLGEFEVRSVVSTDARGLVLAATQPRLERDVILRLITGADDRYHEQLGEAMGKLTELRSTAIPRPLAVGSSEWGSYAAFALRPSRPFGRIGRSRRARILQDTQDTLGLLHDMGLAHGALDADSIRIDPEGNVVLLHAGTAGAIYGTDDARRRDEEALEALRVSPGPSRARLVAGLAMAAAVGAIWMASQEGGKGPEPLPPAPAGTSVIGSELNTQAESIGCDGLEPKPSTVDCSVVRAEGQGVIEIPADGVLRAWAVTNATGELSLQVFRPRGDLLTDAGTSPIERPANASPQQFDSEIAVRKGDLVGLLVQAGSGFGVEGTAGGKTLLYSGSLDRDVTQPDSQTPASLNLPLALRVAFEPGASSASPSPITGSEAAGLPEGTSLEALLVSSPRGGEPRDAVVIRAGEGVALDSFDGKRRVARLPVPDADPGGTLVRFGYWGEEPNGVEITWSNPDGSTVFHQYRVAQSSLRLAN